MRRERPWKSRCPRRKQGYGLRDENKVSTISPTPELQAQLLDLVIEAKSRSNIAMSSAKEVSSGAVVNISIDVKSLPSRSCLRGGLSGRGDTERDTERDERTLSDIQSKTPDLAAQTYHLREELSTLRARRDAISDYEKVKIHKARQ